MFPKVPPAPQGGVREGLGVKVEVRVQVRFGVKVLVAVRVELAVGVAVLVGVLAKVAVWADESAASARKSPVKTDRIEHRSVVLMMLF